MPFYPLINTSLPVVDVICLYSSHLADLKSLTHDVLYETYRTEKLSRTVHTDTQYVLPHGSLEGELLLIDPS